MKTPMKQTGTINMIVITAILFSLLIAVAGSVWVSMKKEIKEKSERIESMATTITGLERDIKNVTSENRNLSNQLELMKEISYANNKEREKRELHLRELEEKVRVLTRKLPTPLDDSRVCKMSAEELKNSETRINFIWDVFRIDFQDIKPMAGSPVKLEEVKK